ncbi:MAG: hypothetical protein BGO67_10340 [Alphaproteobacteria bacterium 41-28]|nr:MAG: hypothetical protein BGO67_10340 [Alphaproteobacteria bacterium 41-28]
MKYPIILEQPPSEENALSLLQQLGHHNQSLNSLYENAAPYGFFIKNENQILGGVVGKLWIGAIWIDRLFVQKNIQGKGYGKKLLEKVEELGRLHNAFFVVLENLSFQNSLSFYLHHGYTTFFKEEGYAHDTIMYHLRKPLS